MPVILDNDVNIGPRLVLMKKKRNLFFHYCLDKKYGHWPKAVTITCPLIKKDQDFQNINILSLEEMLGKTL